MPGLTFALPLRFTDRALPVLPVVLASDSFNRANGPLGTSDAALGGTPRAWEADANVSIYANRWRTNGQSTNRSARVDTGKTDHKVSAIWYAGNGGLVARYADASNHYRLLKGNGGLELYRITNGTQFPMNGPGPMPAPGDRISLQLAGNRITVEMNGSTVWDRTDDDALTAGTRAGIRSAFTEETIFDDFVITNS